MNLVSVGLLSLLLAPPVEVSTFQGEPRSGEWRGLTAASVLLNQAGQESSVPLSEILEVRFRTAAPTKLEKPAAVVTLWDGSSLGAAQLKVADKQLKLTSPVLGELALAQLDVANVRFADRFTSVDDQWTKLTQRELKSDLLVIRKEDTLDYLDGVVVEVTDTSIKFLIDGEEVSVKRDKAFGLIFNRRSTTTKPSTARIEFINGDSLFATAITGSAEGITAQRGTSTELKLPLDQLKALDLSQGKLKYLSQMEPRDVKYTPYFDVTWEYRRDTNMDGGPLRLGNKVYARGLCLHSKTQLKYRLGGEYRRFQAIVGIDHLVASNGYGDCRLVISGDNKPLLDLDVKAKDAPRPIDLDVDGVVVLDILVDFGGNLDISDHLDLADAKLVK